MSKIIDNFVLVGNQSKSNHQGEIFKAKNIINEELVCIKVVKIEQFLQSGYIRDQVMNEISMIKQLVKSTDSVIKIHKMLKSSNHIYIVYEHQENNLQNIGLQAKTEIDILQLINKIVKAYEQINLQNIIHNNLNIENIYIKDSHIKFDEFGLAQQINKSNPLNKDSLTSNMAPELLSGKAPSLKSDLYALGLVFKEMIQKQENYSELFKGLLNDDPDLRFDILQLKQCLFKYERKNAASEPKRKSFTQESLQAFTQKKLSQDSEKFNFSQKMYSDSFSKTTSKNLSFFDKSPKPSIDQIYKNPSLNFFEMQKNQTAFSKQEKPFVFSKKQTSHSAFLELSKERNKYILLMKVIQDIGKLNPSNQEFTIQIGFYLIFYCKLIVVSLKSILNNDKISMQQTDRFFQGDKNIYDQFKRSNEFQELQKILTQETEHIRNLLLFFEQKLSQKTFVQGKLFYKELNQINFKFKFNEALRKYIGVLQTNIRTNLNQGNEIQVSNQYKHLNDIQDIMNLEVFFEQKIDAQYPDLQQQPYYVQLKHESLEKLQHKINIKSV